MSLHEIQSNVGGKLTEKRAAQRAAQNGRRTSTRPVTLGVIVGNRGFFPGHLAQSGRNEMLAALTASGINAVILGAEETNYGAVESRDEAKACAALFKAHRD